MNIRMWDPAGHPKHRPTAPPRWFEPSEASRGGFDYMIDVARIEDRMTLTRQSRIADADRIIERA